LAFARPQNIRPFPGIGEGDSDSLKVIGRIVNCAAAGSVLGVGGGILAFVFLAFVRALFCSMLIDRPIGIGAVGIFGGWLAPD